MAVFRRKTKLKIDRWSKFYIVWIPFILTSHFDVYIKLYFLKSYQKLPNLLTSHYIALLKKKNTFVALMNYNNKIGQQTAECSDSPLPSSFCLLGKPAWWLFPILWKDSLITEVKQFICFLLPCQMCILLLEPTYGNNL